MRNANDSFKKKCVFEICYCYFLRDFFLTSVSIDSWGSYKIASLNPTKLLPFCIISNVLYFVVFTSNRPISGDDLQRNSNSS